MFIRADVLPFILFTFFFLSDVLSFDNPYIEVGIDAFMTIIFGICLSVNFIVVDYRNINWYLFALFPFYCFLLGFIRVYLSHKKN